MYYVIETLSRDTCIKKCNSLEEAKKYLLKRLEEIKEEDSVDEDNCYVSNSGLYGTCDSPYDNYDILIVNSKDILSLEELG